MEERFPNGSPWRPFSEEVEHSYYQPPRREPWYRRLNVRRPTLHVLLFALTVVSTFITGGIWYCASIMAILLAHEMGHYLMCRKYRVAATLPFFIPFPFSPFGTMGAVIKMGGRIPNRRALFDIAVAGPLAGLAFTIPSIIVGLHWSRFVPASSLGAEVTLYREPVLFSALAHLVLGFRPPGHDILAHPLAFAGWAGLFVTGLNLLPIGQLDGGHIVYALFGQKSQHVYRVAMGAFIVFSALRYPSWLPLILLILLFGYRHPRPMDDYTRLDSARVLLGFLTLVIFLVSFTPMPIEL